MQKKIAIIGCGASGMMAAIKAAEKGAKVIVYEHNKPGKKILSTGNGKCNLTNLHMNASCFFSNNQEKLDLFLQKFDEKDTITFFENSGLLLKNKNGYIYPYCEQASVVLQILRNLMKSLGITIVNNHVFDLGAFEKPKQGKVVWVESEEGRFYYDAVIIACGSKAAPKTGSDGSGYDLAKKIGHKLQPVFPSLVQLRCSDKFCKELAGIRTDANIHIYHNDVLIAEEFGELQLTDYGISGIPVFQLSGLVNRCSYKNKGDSITAKIDFLPLMNEDNYGLFCKKRISEGANLTVDELFCGILNQKLIHVILKLCGLEADTLVVNIKPEKLYKVFELFKEFEFHITGSNGFDQAQVCTGGVDLKDVSDELESLLVSNIYFAGEILDVDGRCGGYNLQWAWTSGVIAGEAAAK